MTKNRVALRRMAVCSPLFFPKAASVFYSFELNCDPALPGDTRGWSRSTRGASRKGCASPPLARNVPMRQEGGSDQVPGATAPSSGPSGLTPVPRARHPRPHPFLLFQRVPLSDRL